MMPEVKVYCALPSARLSPCGIDTCRVCAPKIGDRSSISAHAGASIKLYRDEAVKQEYAARQASGLTSPRAVPAWLQALREENCSPRVSVRAINLTRQCLGMRRVSIIGISLATLLK